MTTSADTDCRFDDPIIEATHRWVTSVVVGLNLCPFAKKPLQQDRIRYRNVAVAKKRDVLEALLDELDFLDNSPETETALLVLPKGFDRFEGYLELLDMAEQLIELEDYAGIYQVASFHPEYCFDGEDWDDPANFTNRSPYPMLHLIREDLLEKALESYPNPEGIPEKNMALAREKGVEQMAQLLKACMPVSE
ncbi:Uncharacterised protein [BD1-7 clade bacterium]|uniref:DUF1415 domain-containing protein n=1 Tax=BD1-7 clade bacterium TaxID=2029982 RepID=A0A5S9NSQ8_9GAMM|nr:Uncharacterised protein [BD1-7 clade bacterium]CAA0093686.1 Uncharacterised protein [BD1-7 clade bacterium]